MNPHDIRQAKNPLLRLALPALIRAAERARRIALLTGTPLIVMRDGKLVRVEPGVREDSARYHHEDGT